VRTARGSIRVPTVIVAVNFAKVPKKRPKLCAKTIRERDRDRCQYTGKLLQPDEGSLDHVLPRSRERQGRVGEPRVVEQGRERAQGQPSAARSRPEAVEHPARAERNCR
jgi:5-methylcytosine-specific restriction endonuclease McrA